MSTYADVVISPATTHNPVVSSVSQATRPFGSSARMASSTVSLIWSAILSGWPSVTLSEVKVQRDTVLLSWALAGRVRAADPDDHVEDLPGDRPLVAEVDRHRVGVRPQQRNGVGVVAEAHPWSRHVVGDHEVEALGAQLGAGV